jgi:hypothetical protein
MRKSPLILALLLNFYLLPFAGAAPRLLHELHPEDGRWQVTSFRAPDLARGERYPTRVETRSYDSEPLAREALATLNAGRPPLAESSRPEEQALVNPALWSAQFAKLTTSTSQGLWKPTQGWSLEWEKRYAEWVQNEVQPEFFRDLNLSVDCADVVYSLRFIFSRMHGLRIGVRLAGSRVLFTHAAYDRRWSRLPTHADWRQDQRFRAALEFLLDNTYTASLIQDSYPIKISPEALTAGAHFMDFTTYLNAAHTWIVFRTQMQGQGLPVEMACASEPKQPWVLMRNPFLDDATEHSTKRGGFLKLRWLAPSGTALVAGNRMPDYSLEQYDPAFVAEKGTLGLSTQFRVNSTPDIALLFRRHLDGIRSSLSTRSYLVTTGYDICRDNETTCTPGGRDYEDYSTPSRDRRIGANLAVARAMMAQFGPELVSIWNEMQNWSLVSVGSNRYLTFGEIIRTWESGLYSSDPRDPPLRRWGVSE